MGQGHTDEKSMAIASPIKYIEQNDSLPPILILHGSKDHVVPFTQSVELYQKLKEKHFDVQLARVNNADHGRSIFYVDDVYHCIINFIKSHL